MTEYENRLQFQEKNSDEIAETYAKQVRNTLYIAPGNFCWQPSLSKTSIEVVKTPVATNVPFLFKTWSVALFVRKLVYFVSHVQIAEKEITFRKAQDASAGLRDQLAQTQLKVSFVKSTSPAFLSPDKPNLFVVHNFPPPPGQLQGRSFETYTRATKGLPGRSFETRKGDSKFGTRVAQSPRECQACSGRCKLKEQLDVVF